MSAATNKLFDAFIISTCAVLFGPAIGGFILGSLASVFFLIFGTATLAFLPLADWPISRNSNFSGLGSVISIPFMTAFAAYIPGVPIAALASVLLNGYVVAKHKLSRRAVWLSCFFATFFAVAILLIVEGIKGLEKLDGPLYIGMILGIAVLSSVTGDIVYRLFGRQLFVETDILVVDKNAILDRVGGPIS